MGVSKIVSRDQAAVLCAKARSSGKSVVFTSGVFDLLHSGHVEYLQEAKGKGDLLVVGINSDSSVRSNKGDLRPIVGEADRAAVVAALESVDLVFIFSERNNRINIELLKPEVYAKAGDYSAASLTSAELVESYGGRVELMTFKAGLSSSSLIDKIASLYSGLVSDGSVLERGAPRPAAFIDRDGTINKHVDYLSTPDQFELIPGALDGLVQLKKAGYLLIVTTNQPGIGMGMVSRQDFFAVTRKMFGMVSEAEVKLDKLYFCPHSEADGCSCRKPKTGMIDRACRELSIDLSRSFVIGDATMDIQLASNAGIRSVLVQTGLAGGDKRFDVQPTFICADLLAAAQKLVALGS